MIRQQHDQLRIRKFLIGRYAGLDTRERQIPVRRVQAPVKPNTATAVMAANARLKFNVYKHKTGQDAGDRNQTAMANAEIGVAAPASTARRLKRANSMKGTSTNFAD